jgi:hypothetical protein
MKRILLALTILLLVLPTIKQAEAATDVSIDFFYDNIGSDGNWVEVADYGYCWQPDVAASNSSWRPYSDGYWAYTDVGWTWVSYEDFGWATYHYGRWTRLRDRGWFWVPGREWGPAWVSWRTGGDYVGWAPLPPRGRGDVDYDDRPINGQVDVDFDIGPAYYNFVDVRYIGEPVLRERIVEANLNVTYISQTVNVTNITYTNSTVHNYGPDYNTLSRYSTRPIRRMTLERDANVDLSVAVKSKGLTRVQGDRLIVAAPLRFQNPPKPIAPKLVKEKIEKPTLEHGWSGSDPKVQAEMKQKMKSEDPKNIPPPTMKPRENAETAQGPAKTSPVPGGAGTTPAAAASSAATANPAATAVMVNPASSPAMTPPGRHPNARGDKPTPSISPSLTTKEASPAPKRSNPAERPPNSSSSLITSPDGTPFRGPAIRDREVKKDKGDEKAPDTMPPARQPNDVPSEKSPRKPKAEPTLAPAIRDVHPDNQPKRTLPPERVASPNREAPPDAPSKHPLPPERVAPPPVPGANGPVKTEPPRSKRGPDKKNEPAPSPSS